MPYALVFLPLISSIICYFGKSLGNIKDPEDSKKDKLKMDLDEKKDQQDNEEEEEEEDDDDDDEESSFDFIAEWPTASQ